MAKRCRCDHRSGCVSNVLRRILDKPSRALCQQLTSYAGRVTNTCCVFAQRCWAQAQYESCWLDCRKQRCIWMRHAWVIVLRKTLNVKRPADIGVGCGCREPHISWLVHSVLSNNNILYDVGVAAINDTTACTRLPDAVQ